MWLYNCEQYQIIVTIVINSTNFWQIFATVTNVDKIQLWHYNCDNFENHEQLWQLSKVVNFCDNCEELWQYWPYCLSRIESDILSVMFEVGHGLLISLIWFSLASRIFPIRPQSCSPPKFNYFLSNLLVTGNTSLKAVKK